MSIERTQQSQAISDVRDVQNLKTRPLNRDLQSTENTETEMPGMQVKLSPLAQQIQNDSSHDINMARVEKIKAAMNAGELKLDSNKIAHALLQDIYQLSESM